MTVISHTSSTHAWTMTVHQNHQTVATLGPSPDESWRSTCPCGVQHHYANHGYPTLRNVIDSSFVCYESHCCDDCPGEPHTVITSSHRECITCGRTVKPAMHPAGSLQRILGTIECRIEFTRYSNGVIEESVVFPTQEEFEAIRDGIRDGSRSNEDVIWSFIEALPDDRVVVNVQTFTGWI